MAHYLDPPLRPRSLAAVDATRETRRGALSRPRKPSSMSDGSEIDAGHEICLTLEEAA